MNQFVVQQYKDDKWKTLHKGGNEDAVKGAYADLVSKGHQYDLRLLKGRKVEGQDKTKWKVLDEQPASLDEYDDTFELEPEIETDIPSWDKSGTFKNPVPRWEDIPWHQKSWSQTIALLLIVPVGLIWMMAAPTYYRKKGEVRRYTPTQKTIGVIFVSIAWVLYIAKYGDDWDRAISQALDLSCTAPHVLSLTKNIMVDQLRVANRASDITISDIQQSHKGSDSVLCTAVARVGANQGRLNYEVKLSADGQNIFVTAEVE